MILLEELTKLMKATTVKISDDHWEQLGRVPLERICMEVPPGKAKVRDAARLLDAADKHLCELIDGVLVEKAMDWKNALLATKVTFWLAAYVDTEDAGVVLGAGAAAEILAGQVRIPHVSFYGWHHFPRRILPEASIPRIAPDLAVDVISTSNTPVEMARKLRDYFSAGVKLVWYIYPKKHQVEVFTSTGGQTTLKTEDTLTGDPVLPGFSLSVDQLFATLTPNRSGHK